MSDNTLRDGIRNKFMHGKLDVTSIKDKMRETDWDDMRNAGQ